MLPNLVVVGAQKAGTTSLHKYLDRHPEIAMSERKELDFFAGPGWEWERGLSWYESHFTRSAPVMGESSPSYSAFPWVEGVPERMRAVIPDAKLIYLVRDPVDRMVSEYLHLRAGGHETRPMDEVFSHPRMPESGYVVKGRYHMQLERYLEHYPPEQILVLAHEDLLSDRSATLCRVFSFLGVARNFESPAFAQTHNRAELPTWSRRTRAFRLARRVSSNLERRAGQAHWPRAGSPPRSPHQVDEALRVRLSTYFIDDTARLRDLTGERYEAWCV